MSDVLVLGIEAGDGREGERMRLLAPDVGLFTEALGPGALVAPGQRVGTLLRLGRAAALIVPEGVAGRVVSAAPERVLRPVGYGDVLYELAPLAALEPTAARPEPGENDARRVLASPQSGRFYHRPSPLEPPFAEPGELLEEGRPIGLIEVMKTFAHVPYSARAPLPRRARFVRFLCPDGAEVESGAPLVEVEPA